MFHLNKSCRTDATFLLLIVQRPGPCLAHRPQKAFDGITASRLILPPPPLPGSTFWSQLSRSLISPPPVKIYFIYQGVCLSACAPSACSAHRTEEASDPTLKLQTFLSSYMGAGNCSWVLWKTEPPLQAHLIPVSLLLPWNHLCPTVMPSLGSSTGREEPG